MKVVAFNGSPRPEGNTFLALNLVLDELKKEGIETELVQIGNRKLFNCLACYKCSENKDKQCARKDDDMNLFIEKMAEADGILIGSPVHFSNVSSNVKALIDRCGLVARANDEMLQRKVGRRGGRGQEGRGYLHLRRDQHVFWDQPDDYSWLELLERGAWDANRARS